MYALSVQRSIGRGRAALGLVCVMSLVLVVPSAGSGAAPRSRSSPTDWPVYGHDLSNTRLNSAERAINRKTVATLAPSWSKSGLTGVTGTPTVSRGVAYFGDWTGTVRAVDAEAGNAIWETKIGGLIVGAPAIHRDAVYISSGATLYRLDRATGTLVWKTVTNDHPLAQINASPVVIDGLVIQGVASAEVTIPKDDYTFQGSIAAYSVKSGEEKWSLVTTPNDETAGAGVGIWSTPSVDRKRHLLYVGSGNTYAEPTAPLADSILAIDYRSGKLEWSTQFTAPDVFSAGNPGGKDADVGASPNLWKSKGRTLVGAGDKAGVYHALDRDTGKIVWETRLTAGSFLGGEIGSGALVDDRLVVVSNVGDRKTNQPKNVAKVFALDPDSGDILWETEDVDGKIFAPVSAVRGLAFIGTDTGLLAALDTRTGKQRWSYDAPARTGCGPSIVDGRVLWGYGFLFFDGGGDGGVISFALS